MEDWVAQFRQGLANTLVEEYLHAIRAYCEKLAQKGIRAAVMVGFNPVLGIEVRMGDEVHKSSYTRRGTLCVLTIIEAPADLSRIWRPQTEIGDLHPFPVPIRFQTVPRRALPTNVTDEQIFVRLSPESTRFICTALGLNPANT